MRMVLLSTAYTLPCTLCALWTIDPRYQAVMGGGAGGNTPAEKATLDSEN